MNKENGFTLVELLAVIVVLAIILIIASPQISSTIKESKLKAMRDSAITIATNAEREYMVKTSKSQEGSTITCESIVDMSDDYGTCTLSFNENGRVSLTLVGASGGKFEDITCKGTRNNMKCKKRELLPGYTDVVELLTSKIGTGGLIEDDYGDLRYQGSDPDNYVTFNDETWRIVGLFNVDGEHKIKLVRKDSIGKFSWDSSASNVNSGYGVNQWGPSGTYEGADLMRELNGDYLDLTLTANTMWYNGQRNAKTETFNYTQRLNDESQSLIADATWYLGQSTNSQITVAVCYTDERGTIHTSNPTDGIIRTDTWVGKVGLIYTSDFGYASGNIECKNNISSTTCDDNWMASYGWTLSSLSIFNDSVKRASSSFIGNDATSTKNNVHPSVYLISGIQMKGSGTTADPYVFAE
jgi:type IV pilus assembly protein PilA